MSPGRFEWGIIGDNSKSRGGELMEMKGGTDLVDELKTR